MTAVSHAVQEAPNRVGLVIGIIPCGDDPTVPEKGYLTLDEASDLHPSAFKWHVRH